MSSDVEYVCGDKFSIRENSCTTCPLPWRRDRSNEASEIKDEQLPTRYTKIRRMNYSRDVHSMASFDSANPPDDDFDIQGRKPLHVAVSHANIELTKKLLEEGADVEAKSKGGLPPLWFAIRSGCTHVIQLLIDHGASIDEKYSFFSKGEHIMSYATYAIHTSRVNVLQILLQNGLDVDVAATYEDTLLHQATVQKKEKVITLLLDWDADIDAVNRSHETALQVAVNSEHCKIVKLLVGRGANVNHCNRMGISILHTAMRYSRKAILECLLENGADVHARTNGNETPLHFAARYFTHKQNFVGLLLKYGARVDVKNLSGQTPLHLAVETGCSDTVSALIDAGADINVVDNSGSTPLQVAVSRAHVKTVRLLLIAGANSEPYFRSGAAPVAYPVVEEFAKVLLAKKAVGLKYDEQVLSKIDTNATVTLRVFKNYCMRAVGFMGSVETKKKGKTVLDFLRADRRYLKGLVDRKFKHMSSFILHKTVPKMEVYYEMLKIKFAIAVNRWQNAPVIEEAASEFTSMVKHHRLPLELSLMIVDKLDIVDLKNLIEAAGNVDDS